VNRITTLDLRSQMGELLDRVRLRFESFVVERNGREVAVIIPAERMRRIEDFARRRAAELQDLQDEHVRQKGYDPAEMERAIAESTRE
jgi:prevent-host-death family protein